VILRSPLTGAALVADGHALVATGERWPVIDGIPFLRAGRAALAAAALERLDDGDIAGGTAALLADRDDWASGPGPNDADLFELVSRRDDISFRDAMRLLAYGPVADYLAHRWSDPTFLSGLALADAYWPNGSPRVLEIACGPGQFLRAFAAHATSVTGLDVVWSKLWLARHFVSPDATLICCDVAYPWPIEDDAADLVFCHDAFYFLPEKPHVAVEMARCAAHHCVTLVGHAHNALAGNPSSGTPLTPAEYKWLFQPAMMFDDAALTDAYVRHTTPVPIDADTLAVAVSLVHPAALPRAVSGRFDAPLDSVRVNPLYDANGSRAFPTARYAAEYAALATYPEAISPDVVVDPALIRRRVYVDLPARW